MLEIELKPNEIFALDSKIIPTKIGLSYQVTTEVTGFIGEPFSAYFGIDILHNKTEESDRRVIWLENFSGKKEKLILKFVAPTDAIRIIYRINKETEKKSKCKYILLPINEVSIVESEVNKNEIIKNYFQPRPKDLSLIQESTLEKNLVWFFGSARSGTTWLGAELLSYETYIMREPKIEEHLGFISPLSKVLPTKMEQDEHRPSYFFSFKYRNTWKFFLKKLILNRIHCQFQNLSKKIIIKEPTASSLGFPTIAECFPNSQLIWMLRDGRDVIDSQLDARTHGFSKGGRFETLNVKPITTEDRVNFIKNTTKAWLQITERMQKTFENHSNDLKLLVRYENLRKNTFQELQRIYKFLKIDISESKLEEIIKKFSFENIPPEQKGIGKDRRTAKIGGWQNNFTEEEKDLMNSVLGKMLIKLEYEITPIRS